MPIEDLIRAPIPASELHFTEEIKNRPRPVASKGYEQGDALVYNPETDGSIQRFHTTGKGKELIAQYVQGIAEIKESLGISHLRNPDVRKLERFALRVMQGGGAGSSFSTQSRIIYGYGKDAFDRIRTAMYDEQISAHERKALLKELPNRLDVCAPGVASNLLDVAQRLEMLRSSGATAAAKQAYYEVIEQLLVEFVRARHGNLPANEIHFVNGYRNAVADQFGLHTVVDDFINRETQAESNVRDCSAYLKAADIEDRVIDLMAERCMLAAREHFSANGMMAYEDATLDKQRQLEDAVGTSGLTTTFQALVREVTDPETHEERFALAIDEAAVKRELARSLRSKGVLSSWKSRTLAADAGAGALKVFGKVLYLKERETQEAADGASAIYRRPLSDEVLERWDDLHAHLPQLHAVGIDITKPDAEGRTALMFAARHGNLQGAEFFLHHAPTLINKADHAGNTALDYAAGEGHIAIIGLLMQNGAADSDGRTLLKAASKGHADAVQALLEHGSPIMARDEHWKTAFDYAVVNRQSDILDVLFRNGMVPEMPDRFQENRSRRFSSNADHEAMDAYLSAQYHFAVMHAEGRGVPQNDATAIAWLQNAATRGHAEAEWHLGTMYANGRGVPQNDGSAVGWYKKGAEHGDVRAQYELAVRHAEGRGLSRDDRAAIEWLEKAAAQGHAGAQYDLGLRYAAGRGVEADTHRAFTLVDQAASKGHREARYRLGTMYADGYGAPVDNVKAVELLTEGAEAGDAAAQYRLGSMYADGQGVQTDHDAALGWFLKAAEQDHADEQFRLGIIYPNDAESSIKPFDIGNSILHRIMQTDKIPPALKAKYLLHLFKELFSAEITESKDSVISAENNKHNDQNPTPIQVDPKASIISAGFRELNKLDPRTLVEPLSSLLDTIEKLNDPTFGIAFIFTNMLMRKLNPIDIDKLYSRNKKMFNRVLSYKSQFGKTLMDSASNFFSTTLLLPYNLRHDAMKSIIQGLANFDNRAICAILFRLPLYFEKMQEDQRSEILSEAFTVLSKRKIPNDYNIRYILATCIAYLPAEEQSDAALKFSKHLPIMSSDGKNKTFRTIYDEMSGLEPDDGWEHFCAKVSTFIIEGEKNSKSGQLPFFP